MDDYTARAKTLFDKRFGEVDAEGIYISHQPIYGFRQGHTEAFAVNKYVRSYQILKTLSHLSFSSLLDVGGAEGYKAGLVSSLFGAKSINSDISSIACKRGVQLFGIPSVSADIRKLPFSDEEFDVVLCSETLEHVADPDAAIDELLRIARIAVMVTVPHDPVSVVRNGIEKHDPLGHIHRYDEQSFLHLEDQGYRVITSRMLNWATMVLGAAVEAMPIDRSYLFSLPHSLLVKASTAGLSFIYNLSVPILRLLFGKGTTASIIELDEWVCRFFPSYNALISVILKDLDAWTEDPREVFRAVQVLDFSVPLDVLGQEDVLEHLRDIKAISA